MKQLSNSELFDKTVLPVLIYGCEVWGFVDLKDVEIFYRKFLRTLLKTYNFTPNCMLYGEFGTTDINSKVLCRMIIFWAKLKFKNQDKFSSILCNYMHKMYDSVDCSFRWLEHIKTNLDNSGFSWVWDATSDINIDSFKSAFKQRCTDIFKQKWESDLNENSQCSSYHLFKRVHIMEEYWKLDHKYALNLAKFRTRTHHLPVTRNRFYNNDDIYCELCVKHEIGDEIHYLFNCDYFEDYRKMLLPSDLQKFKNDPEYLFKMDAEKMINLSRFTSIVMLKFKFVSQNVDSPITLKKRKISRSGREIKSPVRLDL